MFGLLLVVCHGRAQNGRALLQEGGGSLSVYNNIVVNNGDSLQDYSDWASNNLFGYHPDIFSHVNNDFRPAYHPLVYGQGYNAVVTWLFDLQGKPRLFNDTVELGAFEYPRIFVPYRLTYPFYQEEGGNLNICNNIALYNRADSSNVVANVTVPSNNIFGDTVDVFMNWENDYRVKPGSLADEGGDNSCVQTETDLKGEPRLGGAAVEIGVFERYVAEPRADTGFVVYAVPGGDLNFCNNIVLYNVPGHQVNVDVSPNNIVGDSLSGLFFHYKNDYRTRPNTLADDGGDNSCVQTETDMKGEARVCGAAVDIGVFERYVSEEQNEVVWPVFVEEGGDLNFCNNIIVHNSADSNVNVTVPPYNMVSNTVTGLFINTWRDFVLIFGSPAIDAGDDGCMQTSVDIKDDRRKYGASVDLGAFERPDGYEHKGYPFWQEEGDSLNICNNIIINNYTDTNINVAVSNHNLVTNSNNVFQHNRTNFQLKPYSPAVDAGLNSCSSWERDMQDSTRILHEVIDFGAFEIYIDYSNSIVYQDVGSSLSLCNNVVILNSPWTPNVNLIGVPNNNIVNDQVVVFRDNLLDFRPLMHCDAVDAGQNSCNGLPTDLDTVKRIMNGRIDIGAYEVYIEQDTNHYAGGGDSGGDWGGYMNPDYNAIVYENSHASLYLCNNIIVNSVFAANTNTTFGLSPAYHNLVTDTNLLFRDPCADFRLNPLSIAVNGGRNDCNNLSQDIDNHDRIILDTIDIGAFEYLPFDNFVAVYQLEQHQMTVCNNIIINNVNAFSVNDLNTPGNNLLIDNNLIFRDDVLDFRPREECAAINFGNNACCPLTVDLFENDRIYADTIDVGAFELVRKATDTIYAVIEHEGHTLHLCNNIVIHNQCDLPVNDWGTSGNNLLVDNDLVFKNNINDFTLREHSAVINAGDNSCNPLESDLKDAVRIFADTIDLGAFELTISAEDTVFAVLQKSEHQLVLCNNIVINNSIAENTNAEVDTAYNIIVNSDDIFVNSTYDYQPMPQSLAVNHGSNPCCPLATDISGLSRIYDEVIDIGAFEPRMHQDSAFALFAEDSVSLVLCNNIIINNTYLDNLNLDSVPDNNIVEDNDTLFRHSVYDFRPKNHSLAINQGNNSCCSLLADLTGGPRVFYEIIDIGAFELWTYQDSAFALLAEDSFSLTLCNNIIINNPLVENLNLDSVPANNIVEDNDTLFRHPVFDYRPLNHTPAINQGDNSCVSWAIDLDKKERIFQEIVDIGAYELSSSETIESYAVLGDTIGMTNVDSSQILRLYNNIIIHNASTTQNVTGYYTGDHNMLTDQPNVFVNEQNNYLLPSNSPAVDAGDNQWVAWETDIKDEARISCANIVDQGAYEHSFNDVAVSLTATQVTTDNCQGYYFLLTATPGAQHYYWSHTNEDTNTVQVSPLMATQYTVTASNGGECLQVDTVMVTPPIILSDTLGAPASMGTKFWLSYLRNHFRPPTLTLRVSAEEACTGMVSNPNTGWNMSFSVADHSVTTVSIPLDKAYSPYPDMVGDYGLLVETSDSVSLFAANYNVSSFDVTFVLPEDALSDEYVLQTYTPMMNAEFVIVATEDNTVVDITPSRALQGGHPAQQTFSVTLQQGQTYLGISQYGGVLGDLSGTIIQVHDEKPVAVFNGNVCALVPSGNSYTDHLVEQAVGTNFWGRAFAITTTQSQNFDRVRVTALRDNTEIRKNGLLLTTLQSYQTYEFEISATEGSCYLESSKPVGVYLYIAGAMQGNPQEKSDPSMIWIPPTEQKLNDITFSTFYSPGISEHYVNIVIPSTFVNDVTLDGVNIGGQFTPLSGTPDLMFTRRNIANGTHRLHCEGGFIAHCYGLGYHESYGYAVGSKAVPLKELLYVNGVLNTELPSDLKFCPYEPIDFSTYVNYPCDSVVWDFGDGSPYVNAGETTHSFAEAGVYNVVATLYITNGDFVMCTSLYARIWVKAGPMVTYYDTVCQGSSYQLHGFDYWAEESGHQTLTRQVPIPGEYCDSTFVLELEVLDNYFIVKDTICVNNHYTAYGFDITPTETGLYVDTLMAGITSFGCDSLLILHLSITPNTDNPPAIEGEPYPCQGGSYVYSIDSLSELTNVVWTVSDSILVMPQSDPYQIELMFATYADSFEICVSATGGCGELNWCRTVYPNPYRYVQLSDTLCAGETSYDRYGFTLTDVSDTNDVFFHYGLSSDGCDSTTVLGIVFMPVYEMTDTILVCENDFPYPYHDTLLAEAGNYQITLFSVYGCDSVVNLTLLANPVHQTVFDTTVCDMMVWYDSNYTVSGSYDVVLTNVFDCDSVVTMQLTVNHSDTVELDSVVCRNQLPVLWNGVTFEDAGTDTVFLTNATDCDSIVVMTVTVNELTENTLTVFVLENDFPYAVNEETYDSAGTYTQILTNAAGCDSALTIQLFMLGNVENILDSTVCQSELPVLWNEVEFTSAGTQSAVLTASTGADSTVVMTLMVIPTTFGVDSLTVCDSLTWIDGITYYESTDTSTFVLENAAGCDSVVTLHLTVNHTYHTPIAQEICQGETYCFFGDTLTESGTYVDTLPTVDGCDSIITLTLTVHPTYNTPVTHEMCQGDIYDFFGDTLTESGTYVDTLPTVNGCDSIITLTLTVHPTYNTPVSHEMCQGESYDFYGTVLTETGTYFDTLPTVHGCDSIITLTLTVHEIYNTPVSHEICQGETYDFFGTQLTESGTYVDTLPTVNGCDSIITLTLTVHLTYNTPVTHEMCQGDIYDFFGDTLTEAGTYVDTLLTVNGCDSIITLTLTVHPTYNTPVFHEMCQGESYDFYGVLLTETGTYLDTLPTVHGCDSIITLTLTVHETYNTPVSHEICQGEIYDFFGLQLTESGTYVDTLPTVKGCDSIITLTLTVHPTYSTPITHEMCQGDIYDFFGDTLTEAGTYVDTLPTVNGCDSIITLTLTVHPTYDTPVSHVMCQGDSLDFFGIILTEPGTYVDTLPTVNGCDSVITLTLTVNIPTDSTLLVTVVENDLPLTLNDSTYAGEGTYIQHLSNAAGCDSVLTIELSVLYNVAAQADSTLCADELPLTWNGVTFTQADTLTAILPAANGADSVITMVLNVKPLSDSMLNVSVVQNDLPYTLNGVDYSATGTYDQHFTNAVGCDSTLTLHLTVYPNVTAQVDTTVCAADLPYTWHGHSFAAAGNHTVTLQTSHGADSTVTYQLSVDNITSDIGNITHITCYGESTGAATATVIGGQVPMTYQWTNDSGTSVSTTTSIGSRPAGAYTFTVTDHIGCTATATVTLNTLNGPLAPGTVSADQVVCAGEDVPPFTGTAASGGDNGAYQWQISTNGSDWTNALGTNNAQTYSYPNSAATAFSLRRAWVSQSCGTAYSNTVTVEVAPNSSDTITAEVCQGESYQEYGFDIIMDQIAEAGDYMFEQHHATGHCDSAVILLLTVNPEVTEFVEATICEGEGYEADGFNVTPQETIGEEELTRVQNLQTVNGCDSVVTLQLTVIDTALRIEMLTEDFCEHNEAALTVISPMPNYVWSTGETATIIAVTSPGVYSVTASEGGCSTTAHIRVEGCQYELVLPNAITPSRGDGLNDCFYIPESFTANINLFKIYIFNRWGELVYYSTDKNFRWYGDYRDETQYQTIYNYVIEYTDTAGRPFRRTGSVTVL